MTVEIPSKLTPDMIHEALFEIRFDHGDLPEVAQSKVLVAMLRPTWEINRLPAAEIPEQIRQADPALRLVPTLEFGPPGGAEVIRIGPSVLSHHIVGRYIGWNSFMPKLLETIDLLRAAIPSMRPTRLGLRYINAPTADVHGVNSIWDLNIAFEIAGHRPSSDAQFIYRIIESDDIEGTVRVLSPSFIVGGPVPNATALLDIDMFTPNDSTASLSADEIAGWLERAHDAEKRAFFSLLKEPTVAALREQ